MSPCTIVERPIVIDTDSVRAILAGRKTQMRRLVELPDGLRWMPGDRLWWDDDDEPPNGDGLYRGCAVLEGDEKETGIRFACPYGVPGHEEAPSDRLWVRETWAVSGHFKDGPRYEYKAFPADGEHERSVGGRWKSPTHMPRAASRLTLEVTEIRVQRAMGITGEDLFAECALAYPDAGPEEPRQIRECISFSRFIGGWDEQNPEHPYRDNPWVWVIEFKRL